jgi:hypothetical protein
MSTATKTRPPTFTTYTEVEVDVEPRDLERAGWVYVGKDKGPTTETVLDKVRRWHDDNHADAWINCRHALCGEVNR